MTPKRQILVVEDNLLNREMLSDILAGQYTVLQAENGQEALNILRQNDRIALILLDVQMPVMDGYTFLDKVKEDKELSLIPVIVTTQSGSEADEIAALSHGATDFVPKPYRPQVILSRVASLIKLRETAAMVNQLQYDRLTDLYTREFFYQKLREQLLVNPAQDYCIVCASIENFRLYNDMFGVPAGDALLRHIGNTCLNMADDTSFVSRFGADSFFCLQKCKNQDWESIARAVDQAISLSIKNVVMRWGVYEVTDRSIPVEIMCDRAQLAANSIKGQYNRFCAVYDDALRGQLLREKAITDAMETALSEKQFLLYLQPKYSLRDECIVGAEALVRWNHPEWGFIGPNEFIPLFEKNGFIFQLDQYVWEQACILLRDWQQQGYRPLPISVNVSRADVYQLHLVDTLQGLVQKYGIDPSCLHLEITESAYAESADQILSTVEELHRLGFVIEMDDFGSGYSSLNMLSQMKLDILKLDMKFIRNELQRPAQQSLLNDIIHMAHKLHLSVVAEGVETSEQVKRLHAMDCDYLQGYFFAKPMPVAQYEQLWKDQLSRAPKAVQKAQETEWDVTSVLVVDEDASYRKKVHQVFAGQYQVMEESNASSALALIREHGQSAISAIILSLTLPENGAAMLVESLRQDSSLWKIPILATIPNSKKAAELPLALETDDFLCKRHPICDLRKRVQNLIDIAQAHRRESILRDEAHRDYLTGLLNRRGFQAAIASIRTENLPLAVCMFDLDNLKKVNDTFGHDTGDRMIRAFADLLRSQTRTEDVLCRYGGDEFAVILKHLDSVQTAMDLGQRICSQFNDSLMEEPLDASCSGGIAVCGKDERDLQLLLEKADEALRRAKQKGKSQCLLWD